MSEPEMMNVEPEAQEVVQSTESEATSNQSIEEQAQKKIRDDQAYNWAEANRKIKELERQNREMQEHVGRLDKPKAPVQEEDDLGIGDGDLAEGKHLKTLNREIKQLKSQLKEQQISTIDSRLQLQYPDFGQVVTAENIETLKQTDPELAATLRHNPDPYQQGIAAYKLLKRLGISQEQTSSPEKDKAKANVQKPVSVNAVTKQSAIGNAHLFENGLTKELKASLWKEMQELSKRA